MGSVMIPGNLYWYFINVEHQPENDRLRSISYGTKRRQDVEEGEG
jgi:hypothetical protein